MSPGTRAPLETGKGKETESPQRLQKEHGSDDTLILASGTYKIQH